MQPNKKRADTELSTQFNNFNIKPRYSNITLNPNNQFQENNQNRQPGNNRKQQRANSKSQKSNKSQKSQKTNSLNKPIFMNILPPKNQQDIKLQKFQPFKIPPDIKLCEYHREATQFGKPVQTGFIEYQAIKQLSPNNTANINQTLLPIQSPKMNNSKQKVCICCGQQPKQILPVCSRIQQIYDVNQPLGYYFSYIKVMCIMLFFIGISLGVYTTIQVVTDCQQLQNCIYVYGVPILKFHLFFTDILMILNVIAIVIIYVCISYLYYLNAHVHKKIFINHKKPSDYCVLLSGMDHTKVTGQDLINYFRDYQIVDILYTHRIQKYIKSLAKKSVLTAKRNLYFRRGLDKKIEKIDKLMEKLNHHLIHVKNKFNLRQQKDIRTDKVIIRFKTIKIKQKFQEQYKEKMYQTILHSFCGGSLIEINGNKMYVQPIGQPHEIVWQNLEVKSKQRYLRVLVGNIMTLIILGCSYLIITFLSKEQKDVQGTGDILLSIVFSVVIQVVNFILGNAIQRLTDWERRYTLTGKVSTILIKDFISFFLNTTLIPFTLFLFTWGSTDQDDLVRNIFTLFLITNFVSPFISMYLNPGYLYTLYKRKQIRKQGQDCVQTQMKANEYFQKVDFQLNSKYSLVLQKMTNCLFYAAVFPVGILITFFGLGLTYWISKWWLIKYCSIPKYSYRLGKLISDLTTLFPVIFSFGYLANLYMTPSQTKQSQIFALVVGLATVPISFLFFLFGNRISEWFVKKQYASVQNQFQTQQSTEENDETSSNLPDYRQLNPTTFLHSQIHRHIAQGQFQNLFANLQSYAFAKQASHLRRSQNISRRSSLSSKISSSKTVRSHVTQQKQQKKQ